MTAQELFEIGMAYERMGKMDHALRSYSSIIAQWPHEIAPYHRLSVIALEQRDPSLALVWIEKALAIDNDVVGLWNNRALALAELARFDEAHSSFERAIELNKNNWEAYYNLGRMLLVQKRYAEAEAPLRQAAEIDPNSADTFNNLGLVLHQLYRYEEACDAFDRAIALKPDYIETISNKGASLYFSHRFPEAEDTFNKAIAIAPDSTAGVRYNLACLKMCQGRLKEGLEEYEWRWKTPEWVRPRKYFGRPLWRGNTLRGETILVWHEQGLGDTIQFVRYIHDLAKQDCEIVVEVQPQLYRLLTASFSLPNVKFIRAGATPPTFDLHVPMISLARILGITYESMPAIKPYVRPRGREIEDWRGKLKTLTLPENRRKKRIGIAWYGN